MVLSFSVCIIQKSLRLVREILILQRRLLLNSTECAANSVIKLTAVLKIFFISIPLFHDFSLNRTASHY